MASLPSTHLIPWLLHVARANRIYVDPQAARRHIAAQALRPASYAPPRRLRRDVALSVATRQGWPIYALTPRTRASRGHLVYVHGGGWVNQIVRQHWQLAAQLAAEADLTVTVPIYPLIPFGTAEPVVDGVADLLAQARETGLPTFLAGDSAGGQIALSAALRLRDRGVEPVARTVLIAAALDLTLSNPGIDRVLPSDPWLGRAGTRVLIEAWRGELPVDNPTVSPLFGDLTGLGPLLLFNGGRDVLTPDARLLVARARDAGVAVEYVEAEGLVHVYPLTPTREGRAARAQIVRCLRQDLRCA